MRNRRKNIDAHVLDLHGVRHSDVDRLVENFIFLTPCPHEIITGNSRAMQKIVLSVLDRHGFQYEIGDINNKGYLIILG